MNLFATIIAGAWHSFAVVSLGALAAAIALHVGKLGAEARSWYWIVSHAHSAEPVHFSTTLGAFMGAIGVNAVLPARVGEALRIGIVRRRVPGSNVIAITATVVLETAIEVAFGAAVIAAVLLAGWWFGSSGSAAPVWSGLAGRPVVLGVFGFLVFAAVVLGVVFRRRARALVERMAAGFAIVRSPRAFVARVLSWKIVAWTFRLGSVYAFLLAFHVPAAPWTALVVVAAQNVAASVPLLPGNAGTQQAAIGAALAGTASTPALLGFGVGMQAATAIADIVLGAAALLLVASRGDIRSTLATLRVGRSARAAASTVSTALAPPAPSTSSRPSVIEHDSTDR